MNISSSDYQWPCTTLPTFWPPFDRAAAAGMGEMYGAAIRALDAQRTDSGADAMAFLDKSISVAQEASHISEGDGQLIRALARLNTDESTSESAAQLFERALADENTSVTVLSLLSIAKYVESSRAPQDSPPAFTDHEIAVMAYGLLIGPGGIAAEYVYSHLHVTWT